jgi:hypothetical protein
MTCRDVENALAISSAGEREKAMSSVRAHLETCESCREFVRIVEFPSIDMPVDSSQLGRLQKMILGDLRPVRPLLPTWVFFSAFVIVFVVLSYVGISYLKPYGWFVLMPAQKLAIFSSLAASAGLLTFSLVRQMVPGQKSLLRPGLLPVVLFVFLCLVVASVFQVKADPHFLEWGYRCMKAGVPYGIPAAFVFWLILRRGAILSPRVVGAITGMLAGLVSTTVLEVHCPYLNVWHILVWHFGIALLGLLVGLLVAVAGQAVRHRLS